VNKSRQVAFQSKSFEAYCAAGILIFNMNETEAFRTVSFSFNCPISNENLKSTEKRMVKKSLERAQMLRKKDFTKVRNKRHIDLFKSSKEKKEKKKKKL
jgi:hypothetical protein